MIIVAKIKLHKKLLDNFEYQCLPVGSRALAPMLWLLADQHGTIDVAIETLAYRFRMTEKEISDALKPLIDGDFFVSMDGNKPLAPTDKPAKKLPVNDPEIEARFEQFYAAYPRKVAKDAAKKAYLKRLPTLTLHNEMLRAVEEQKNCEQWRKDGGQFIPHPATWLNQARWEDEIATEEQGYWYEGMEDS